MTIKDFFSDLVSTYIDWQGEVLEANYFRDKDCISWNNVDIAKLFTPIVSVEIFNEMRQRRQFSFSTEDGSFFQLLYQFNTAGDRLVKARLAFFQIYEPEKVTSFEKDEMYYKEGELVAPTKSLVLSETQPELVRWLRVDYDPDPKVVNRLVHYSCHAQLSAFENTRVVVDTVPTPSQFVEKVFQTFFPDIYSKKRDSGYSADTIKRLKIKNLAPDPDKLSDLIGRITFGGK
jgi:hypothetical protein